MEDPPNQHMETLAALVAALSPRRRHDIGQRLRFLAASSEGWAEPVYLALADVIADQQQDDEPSA